MGSFSAGGFVPPFVYRFFVALCRRVQDAIQNQTQLDAKEISLWFKVIDTFGDTVEAQENAMSIALGPSVKIEPESPTQHEKSLRDDGKDKESFQGAREKGKEIEIEILDLVSESGDFAPDEGSGDSVSAAHGKMKPAPHPHVRLQGPSGPATLPPATPHNLLIGPRRPPTEDHPEGCPEVHVYMAVRWCSASAIAIVCQTV